MKDQDLQLESVKAFPVWPKTGWDGIHQDNQVIGLCLETYTDPCGLFEKGEFHQVSLHATPDLWQIACTREQHIRKRVELFESAPDDAEAFSPEDDENHACFYKNEYKYMCIRGFSVWSKTEHSIDEVVIPRPTPEELAYICNIEVNTKGCGGMICEDGRFGEHPIDEVEFTVVDGEKEWVPEVGKQALLLNQYNYDLDYGEGVIGKEVTVRALFMSDGSLEMAAVENNGINYCFRSSMLNPLKTEADKKLEILSSSFLTAFDSVSDDFPPIKSEALHALCKAMTDLGFTVPNKDTRPLKERANELYELVKDAVDLYQACEILIEAGYKK